MEIVPSTNAEFDRARAGNRHRGSPRNPNHAFLLTMQVNEVVRIVAHPHETPCKMGNRMYQFGINNHLRLRLAHDGPDLLVMRVK